MGRVNSILQTNPLLDVLHRVLWLIENEPRNLTKFLDESRPDRERFRLVAQALAGTALERGSVRELERGDVAGTTPKERAALQKLVANWRSLIERRFGDTPLFERRTS